MNHIPLTIEKKIKNQLRTSDVLFQPVAGGGNNKIYKISCADKRKIALKLYNINSPTDKLRLQREFKSLAFLNALGEKQTPGTISCDEENAYALYEWIEGEKLTAITDIDLSLVLDFITRLKGYSLLSEAKALAKAADNALNINSVVNQLQRRLNKLNEASQKDLKKFLNRQYQPCLKEAIKKISKEFGTNFEDTLSYEYAILSPSDFGFHNALKAEGKLFFLDFEYFGWDDPSAMLAHFLLHPAMNLTEEQKIYFKTAMFDLFSADLNFQSRFNCLFPLIGLSWILILLNEFIPSLWQRRVQAGAVLPHEHQTKCQLQLQRAQHFLANLRMALSRRGISVSHK